MVSYNQLLKNAEKKLIENNFDKKVAKIDAEEILLHTARISKSDLIVKSKEEVSLIFENIFLQEINRRIQGKPVQYITNNAEFFGYNFFVNESCLIPRVDSEILVEKALEFVKNQKKIFENKKIKILDACCGSGCLGLSLCKVILDKKIAALNMLELTLLDKSSPAIQVAKINTQKFGLKAKFIISDVLLNGFGNEKYDPQ